jgi:hypothetical protein
MRGAFTLDSNSRASVPTSSITTRGEISNMRLVSRSTSAAASSRVGLPPNLDGDPQFVEIAHGHGFESMSVTQT